ncbi:MAG: long-chain-fatty-acid--CoA ligase [Haloarcula sp.]
MRKELLVTDFLDRARTYYDDKEALLATSGERFTYEDLGERADRFSAALQGHGITKGDRVAVLDPNTHYHMEAAHGIMQIGAVHTPLNYRLTPDDFAYILSDADVDAIYADYEYARKVEAVRDEIPTELFVTNDADRVDGDWLDFDTLLAESPTTYDRPEMTEDELITINYTSGTTGDPKGVMRTHRTETLHAYLISIHHHISDDDVYLWTLPMFHANGWGHIFALTGLGARQICTRGVDVESIFDTVVAEDVSYMCAAPTVLDMLIDHYETNQPQTTGNRDVRIATGGSAPPEATIRTIEDDIGWHLQHIYGATETGPLTLTSDFRRFYDADSDDRFAVKKRQGIGFLGTDVAVVDDEGNPIPQDDETIGEIVINGHQVMEGYRNKPEATQQAFHDRIDGWYHSGDLATVDENGFISIKDRKKDIIVSGGENISSVELEDVLYDHPAVGAVAVIPSPSDEWGETPKAFVVPADGTPDNPGVDPETLTSFTREHLANYKAVTRVEFVEDLPTTATGKVQKYELREREWADEETMVGQG